jgi:hypothetical protein
MTASGDSDGPALTVDRPLSPRGQLRAAAGAGLLAAGCVAWSAAPVHGSGAGTRLALIAAVCCGVLAVARLAAGDWAPAPAIVDSAAERALSSALGGLRSVPWATGMVIAVLVLEVLHRSRPWHTGLLGVALLAFLLAVHLAESGTGPAVLRPQLPVLLAALGVLAIGCGAALLPPAGGGLASGWLRVFAALAAIAAAALALPL